jgi:hypothetical protein
MEKILAIVPNDRDLRKIYTQRADALKAYSKRKERIDALGAVWQGLMTVEDRGKTKTRYVVLRVQTMVWFRSLQEAENKKSPLGVVTFKANMLVSQPDCNESMCRFIINGDMPEGKEVTLSHPVPSLTPCPLAALSHGCPSPLTTPPHPVFPPPPLIPPRVCRSCSSLWTSPRSRTSCTSWANWSTCTQAR